MTNPTSQEDRTVAIVSYLTLIGFIVALVLHSSKKSALGSFHLRQMLGLILTSRPAGCSTSSSPSSRSSGGWRS